MFHVSLPHLALQRRQILPHPAGVGMIFPEELLKNIQRAVEGGAGGVEVDQVLQHPAQVVDADRHVGLVWPNRRASPRRSSGLAFR
jgi:hypothetical protein